MDPEDFLFNQFSREHLPLSRQLRIYEDRLRNQLNAMQLDQVAGLTRQDMAKIVDSLRCEVPALGKPDGNWCGPGDPYRYYAAVAVLGAVDLLRSWPDEIANIQPIDTDDAAAATLWQIVSMPASPTQRGIGTFIRLTPDEHRQEKSQPTVQARLAERIEMAKPFVAAIAEQVQRFFDVKLVDLGMATVEERKLNRSIAATLTFPLTWKIPAPKVITESQNPPDQLSLGGDSAGQLTTAPTAESTTAEHVVPYRQRLDPASFEDVQRVTRIWANSVQRYPAAFRDLTEDRISDLLAATLNATLPGAHREVYSRGGKSDIFIVADVLAEGSGPAKIFICESKFSSGKDWVMSAVDQLYGYLTTDDTSAMLLLLFRQQDFQAARSNAYKWLRAVDGHEDEAPSAVTDWPIFVYVRGPYRVRLCVASVHLPPTDPSADSQGR